ncbi:hypothetical protein AYL99_09816 [Fonsecaea erecta]|uniref:Calponin-homology (CH) domain-containing protein n=1 Tax=Fonsecaea erecta TaxID=1367422 RepID=A0A178Z7B3_9EURO|nr:hypothetical protein AYL99_09816 [Fonsecaea erecta]OAP55664.1 hypothetical protein AYL99_09816 [Fonsecaea erecta]
MPPPSSAAAIGTPCPVPLPKQTEQQQKQQQQQQQQQRRTRHHGHRDRDSLLLSPSDDTTANLEFTSAFAAPFAPGVLKNARPRRRRAQDGLLGFTIHEDTAQRVGARGGGDDENPLKTGARRRAAISQPPQRPQKRAAVGVAATAAAALAPSAPDNGPSGIVIVPPQVPKRGSGASARLSQAPRRPITSKAEGRASSSSTAAEPLRTVPEDTVALLGGVDAAATTTTMLRPARRATFYIPTEDTTMPSMYMGIFSPIKNLDPAVKTSPGSAATSTNTERPSKPDDELTGIAAQMVAKKNRGTTKDKGAASAKPMPLQTTTKPLQESTLMVDRWGQGGGKENVPPGEEALLGKKDRLAKGMSGVEGRGRDLEVGVPLSQQQLNRQQRDAAPYEPTAGMWKSVRMDSLGHSTRMKSSQNAGPRLRTGRLGRASRMEELEPKSRAGASERESLKKKPSVPSRFVLPKVDAAPVSELYPVITEDVVDPAMYEDNWLRHQEIAITQLVNNLFGASAPAPSPVESEMLKLQLLERYGDPSNVMLYKRLQAALLYGALSVPRDMLKGTARLGTDLGKRKAFTDLWLDTYELSYLRAALEVVVGRRIKAGRGHGVGRRMLQHFIEIFLIRNEDGQPDDASTDHVAWSYQRTLLRSLMVIKLLDTMKAATSASTVRCLFQPGAACKTSVGVVQALFQLLNPSVGDPMRALVHVGYTVTYAQHALAEYCYKMDNLAVDLRDGVRLTRLVELLLYPFASPHLDFVHDSDSTTSIFLPTGQELSLTDGDSCWPLSQHLKYPCPGRATKLYNVQVALSAIQQVKGLGTVADSVKAEDIVDGFREKTVKLLWGLTSQWGLASLVDWDDVECEIKRLCRTGASSCENDYFDLQPDEHGRARHTVLLKAWAQAIASQHGIQVINMTTSFTDGRVFQAIVEEYEGYLSYDVGLCTSRSLAERLRRLGCSEQFAMLFSPAEGVHVFDRDFVVATLAFLCSRLLQPTKAVRAAVTIQRRWRWYWARVVEHRKGQVKVVAASCAAVALQRGMAGSGDTEHEQEEEEEQGDEDIWLSL